MSEGLPLALLEAMFAARPIVASDVGEIGAVLADGAGVVAPPGSAAALALAIDRLLGSPSLARSLAQQAYRKACDEYDVSRMVARYGSLYDRVLRAARHRSLSPVAHPAR